MTKGISFYYKPVTALYFAIVLLWILIFNPYLYNYLEYNPTHYVAGILILSGLVIKCVTLYKIELLPFNFSILDLLFLLYLLTVVLSSYLSKGNLQNEGLISLLVISAMYIFLKLSYSKEGLILLITIASISFFIEVFVAAYQFIAISKLSLQTSLIIKGTLDNSGLLSAYIVILCPLVLLTIAKIMPKSLQMRCSMFILILTVLVLFLTKSRGAMIAFIVPLVIFFRIYFAPQFHRSTALFQTSVTYKILLLAILPVIGVGLFYFKIESALGRVLIWNVTLAKYTMNPFLGIGFGEFQYDYPFWQAEYLVNPGNGSFLPFADITNNAFNEPLQILVETGLVGFLIFMGMIYMALNSKPRVADQALLVYCCKGSLLSVIIFSLFSYPFHSTPILFVFILLLSILSISCESRYVKANTLVRGFLLIGVIFLSAVGIKELSSQTTGINYWERARNESRRDVSLTYYKNAYTSLSNNGMFLHDYGVILLSNGDLGSARKLLEESTRNRVFLEDYLFLGAIYERLGLYDKAESNFIFATKLLPNRFKPLYVLMNFYIGRNQLNDARIIADKIITMPAKIVSFDVIHIKNNATSFIKHGKIRS